MGDCMDWDICLQTLLFMYIQGYLGKINFLQILLERQTSKYCHSRVVGIMFLLHFFNRNFFFFFLSNFLKRASTYLNQQCGKKLLTVYLHHFFFSRERTQKGKSGRKKKPKKLSDNRSESDKEYWVLLLQKAEEIAAGKVARGIVLPGRTSCSDFDFYISILVNILVLHSTTC